MAEEVANDNNEVIRILSNLVAMFDDGELNTRFDRIKNVMVADDTVRAWVERARKLVPAPQITGAADKMRKLENADDLIEAAPNVTDLRKRFAIKTAENGGAMGLIREIVTADNNVARNTALRKMAEFVDVVDTNQPPANA